MPARSSAQLKKLNQFLTDTQENFNRSHPAAAEWLSLQKTSLPEMRQMNSSAEAEAPSAANDDQLLQTVTREETASILGKLQELASGQVTDSSRDQMLYIEQQLTDLLGFEITSELEGQRIPYLPVRIKAGKHLKRYPGDNLSEHGDFLESGMASRSGFGWLTENGQITDRSLRWEQYYVSLPLSSLEDWKSNRTALKTWYFKRKVIVINPYDLKAVVGVVADIGPDAPLQYQCAASPELIRATWAWSPRAQGRVLIYFISDSQDEVAIGQVNLPLINYVAS